jgi:hypothetical protein
MTVSVGEYLSTVYEPDSEYVEGELIGRNAGDSDHSALLGILIGMLANQCRAAGIHIFPTLRVQVCRKALSRAGRHGYDQQGQGQNSARAAFVVH